MKNIVFIIALAISLIACTDSTSQKAETVTAKKSVAPIEVVIPEGEIEKIKKSEEEWKKELTKSEFYVLRNQGTERPFTSELLKNKKQGTYVCKACQLPLFSSETKFKSGTGWPSFYKPLTETVIGEDVDETHGMRRVEVHCARCDGHMGHVFEDGPEPTGLRYCINGVSLDFVADNDQP